MATYSGVVSTLPLVDDPGFLSLAIIWSGGAHSVKYTDLVCENEVDNPPM